MYVSDIYWACEELSRGDLYQGRYIRHIGDLRWHLSLKIEVISRADVYLCIYLRDLRSFVSYCLVLPWNYPLASSICWREALMFSRFPGMALSLLTFFFFQKTRKRHSWPCQSLFSPTSLFTFVWYAEGFRQHISFSWFWWVSGYCPAKD